MFGFSVLRRVISCCDKATAQLVDRSGFVRFTSSNLEKTLVQVFPKVRRLADPKASLGSLRVDGHSWRVGPRCKRPIRGASFVATSHRFACYLPNLVDAAPQPFGVDGDHARRMISASFMRRFSSSVSSTPCGGGVSAGISAP